MPPTPRGSLLSIYPSRRGFGFAVGGESIGLSDWGLARVRSKSIEAFVERVDGLAYRHAAFAIIVEDTSDTLRGERVKRCVQCLAQYASERRLGICVVARHERIAVLSLHPRASNHDIATAIAMRFPELEVHLPSRRRRWQSEDERIAIFAAVSCLLVGALRCIPPTSSGTLG